MDLDHIGSVSPHTLTYSAHRPSPTDNTAEPIAKLSENTQGSAQVSSQLEQKNAKVDEQADDNLVSETKNVTQAVSKVSEFLQVQNRQLNFTLDDESEKLVITVTDKETGEMIRQIPSEEMLELAKRIEQLRSDAGETVGILVNREV
ncbi:flagellar protein FlaG [Gayadomonas joobiniege]|uniref:flagellar protein FlaG n=1 Tax=Gayadomonas joobiniege TaxID=1234606 RepID=UPI0003650937|nr:flagellar protein FlaG [Gayadomonas joobiniege]